MTLEHLLRTLAIAIAVIGVIDPPWTLRHRAPVPVLLETAEDDSDAAAVRRALESRLGSLVTFDSANEPAAIVLAGAPGVASRADRGDVPVSVVMRRPTDVPNVRVVEASDPAPVRTGWTASIKATVEARGLAGETTTVVLETQGAELTRMTHAWTRDVERFEGSLRFTPPHAGALVVTVRALPLDGEQTTKDNAADVRLEVKGERLRILVHEPRPSWNATFLRRALEEDPTFDVSTFVAASKGLAVRAGTPPPALTLDALTRFDAIVVGAPEELRASEVDALRQFALRRGGAVVLVPDRRPSGPYLDLMPGAQFEEVLVNDPMTVGPVADTRLRASEFAVYRPSPAGSVGTVLATIEHGKSPRPVVMEWLTGEGRVIFSGALDAWRYRADKAGGFPHFWRARISEGAEAAPPRLAVTFTPGAPAIGDEIEVRARLRPTELTAGGSIRVPAVSARLVDTRGRADVVRLWPTAEPGMFAGRARLVETGNFDLQVRTESGLTVDKQVSVASVARRPTPTDATVNEELALIAQATGGVAVDSDLTPLEQHLRSIPAGEIERTVHPWRSPLIVMAFVALLSSEWALRRRRGLP